MTYRSGQLSGLPSAAMTMRVSRDSGHTWGPTVHVSAAKEAKGDQVRCVFPPCECARCAEDEHKERQTSDRPLRALPGGRS